ncbi:DNA topoisomerase IV subunit A [Thiomonas sp.]
MTDTAQDTREKEPIFGTYASSAYLAYAMSVVTGRAIPALTDGQKPVQRRILYAMREMGLQKAQKHVKSARVVGEVLGKFHPHGDSSSYEAMVRMAQDFSLRYPLIDGQGNFGSRDGDGAAAMRYTEAKLTPIAALLLDEVEEGTVGYKPNYDGTLREPELLPARLPFLLLNGASGIAVGLATEIPSHNLREVGQTAARLALDARLSDDDILGGIPGPDYPGGGQIISEAETIRQAYRTGRGSLRVRARWEVEKLSRGEWRVLIQELPPGVSTAQVLAEIETASNPQIKTGKKALTPEQATLKAAFVGQIDRVRDESGKSHKVRLVIEPRSKNQSVEDLMRLLLGHTSLETNAAINLTVIDPSGRAPCLPLTDLLRQWVDFRIQTVRRRSQFRLDKAEARIHILEGRMRVLLDIDAVIHVIRNADDPKADLMAQFDLSEIQAEDILEIRLRQLARLAGIEIEKELAQRQREAQKLRVLLTQEKALRKAVAAEITTDTEAFGDDRRTLLQTEVRVAPAEAKPVLDEPVTVIVSRKGWLRTRSGHGIDTGALVFKDGDALLACFELRTPDHLVALDQMGRAYSVPVRLIPGGKGDGIPITSQVDFQPGGHLAQVLAGPDASQWLIAGTGGYGFRTDLRQRLGRNKAGKAFLSLEAGESPLAPVRLPDTEPLGEVAALSSDGKGLVFSVEEIKSLPKGKGVKLMHLEDKATLKSLVRVLEAPVPGFAKGRLEACRGKRGGAGRKASGR